MSEPIDLGELEAVMTFIGATSREMESFIMHSSGYRYADVARELGVSGTRARQCALNVHARAQRKKANAKRMRSFLSGKRWHEKQAQKPRDERSENEVLRDDRTELRRRVDRLQKENAELREKLQRSEGWGRSMQALCQKLQGKREQDVNLLNSYRHILREAGRKYGFRVAADAADDGGFDLDLVEESE